MSGCSLRITSLFIGLAAVPDATRVLVTPVDVQPVLESVLDTLRSRSVSAVPHGPNGDGHLVGFVGGF
jgi:hypothetical protein